MMNKKIYKRALTLAVPMMIQNGITNMVSLVDNVMVGSLGTEAMTGVSIVGQLFFCAESGGLWWIIRAGNLWSPVLRER